VALPAPEKGKVYNFIELTLHGKELVGKVVQVEIAPKPVTRRTDLHNGLYSVTLHDANPAMPSFGFVSCPDEGLKKLAAKGIHATGHFAIGDPLDQIPYFAKELNVDLIVVGHHRAGRLARWWGGRTDGLLLDRVSCSVLVTMGPQTESAAESASESRGAASPGETTSPVEHS